MRFVDKHALVVRAYGDSVGHTLYPKNAYLSTRETCSLNIVRYNNLLRFYIMANIAYTLCSYYLTT